MKQAKQVTAAVEIVQATHAALANAMEDRQDAGWDTEILVHEIARLLAALLRSEDVAPSELENVLGFLRKVYGGISPTQPFSVEQALARFCGGSEPDADDPSGQGAPSASTLH
jgi:hypothetical protein